MANDGVIRERERRKNFNFSTTTPLCHLQGAGMGCGRGTVNGVCEGRVRAERAVPFKDLEISSLHCAQRRGVVQVTG